MSEQRKVADKGSAVTGSGQGSHFSSASCELNPEALGLWLWRLRWSLSVEPRR